MAHKFDPSNIRKLDDPERRKILPPEEILKLIGLKPGDRMIDIGAGSGYFSIPAARMVGNEGLVTAVDDSGEMIKVLESRVKSSSVANIQVIQSREYDFKTEGNLYDYALLCAVLHEVEDKVRFLLEAKRVLMQGGRLAVIDWQKSRWKKDRLLRIGLILWTLLT
jgi:ubiquinone/menaquinone biosynthesis C-methylase UbiE